MLAAGLLEAAALTGLMGAAGDGWCTGGSLVVVLRCLCSRLACFGRLVVGERGGEWATGLAGLAGLAGWSGSARREEQERRGEERGKAGQAAQE